MAISITSVKMAGGSEHEHIANVKWTNPETRTTGENSRSQMVQWLEESDQNVAWVGYGKDAVRVGVRRSATCAWIQTHADAQWNNNLLSLPRY